MDYIDLKKTRVSRFILGGNPFSGFSHQGQETDAAMKHYYTTDVIKDTIRQAESLGVNTLIARLDRHIMRMLMEYWDEGGKIQWFAQIFPEHGNYKACVTQTAAGGAKACHIHGGVMDFHLAQKKLDEIPRMIDLIREKGMLAGIAGHNPAVFEWAQEHLDVDYYLCSYYNAAHRDQQAELVPGVKEWFLDQDRRIMTDLIATLSKPVIHYKIMAAGRNDPEEAFAHVAKSMRSQDAVCVGVFTKDKPDMLREDVEWIEQSLAARQS